MMHSPDVPRDPSRRWSSQEQGTWPSLEVSRVRLRAETKEFFLRSSKDALSGSRSALRERIMMLWDNLVQRSQTAPVPVSVGEYSTIQAKLRVMDPSAPRGLGYLLCRLQGWTSVTLARRTQVLAKAALKEIEHLEGEIDARMKMRGELQAAIAARVVTPNVLAELQRRLVLGSALREHRRAVLLVIARQGQPAELWPHQAKLAGVARQLADISQLFERLSSEMLEEPTLDGQRLARVEREQRKFLNRLGLSPDQDGIEMGPLKRLQIAIEAEEVLHHKSLGGAADVLLREIKSYRDSLLESVLSADQQELHQAVRSQGGRISVLMWHPVIEQIVRSLTPPNPASLGRGQDTGSSDPATRPSLPPVVQYLIGEAGLPPQEAQNLCVKWGESVLEERVSCLRGVLPQAATTLLRRQGAGLDLPGGDFARYMECLERARRTLAILDPFGVLTTVQPSLVARRFSPDEAQRTLDFLNSCVSAKAVFDVAAAPVNGQAEALWCEFLSGINRLVAQDVPVAPEQLAARVRDYQYPKNFSPELVPIAARKLTIIFGATILDQLRRQPGNRFEILQSMSQHSPMYCIRINDVWRIRFRFYDGCATDVAVVKYH